jgi:anti-sigma B factor antagonist
MPDPVNDLTQTLSLTISTRDQSTGDDAIVVKCSGRLIAGTSEILRTEVKPLISQSKRIVLDLTDLTQLDSLGLGAIIGLYVSAKAAGCELKLINLRKRIREVFHIANLLPLFEYYGDLQIAAGVNQIPLDDPEGSKRTDAGALRH